MVSSEPNKSSDKTHSREIKCPGRSVKQNNQTNLNRMGSQSIGCERSFSNDPISQFRSVCNSSKSQTSTVCISHSGPKGTFNRRSQNELESQTQLCVSTFPSHSLSDKKIRTAQCKVVLIAPFWPNRMWFPELLNLLISSPITLPIRPNLLEQLHGKFLHQNPGLLQLQAWELSNNPSEIKNFKRSCRSCLQGS